VTLPLTPFWYRDKKKGRAVPLLSLWAVFTFFTLLEAKGKQAINEVLVRRGKIVMVE
jgi:hypothetical protein